MFLGVAEEKRLKRETEGLIMVVQEQALRTNDIKANINKQGMSPACRLLGERKETVANCCEM